MTIDFHLSRTSESIKTNTTSKWGSSKITKGGDNGRWTTERRHNYPPPSPMLSLCWWVSASVSSMQTIPALQGEHSPEISTATIHRHPLIKTECISISLFSPTDKLNLINAEVVRSMSSPMLWKPSSKVQLLKQCILQVIAPIQHSAHPGYETELSLWLWGLCVIAHIRSFCFGRILNEWMLLLYLAVGPSSVQALRGEILSVRLAKFFPTCFLTVVLK